MGKRHFCVEPTDTDLNPQSMNSANQSPCSVASSLLGVCSGGSYDVKALPENSRYLGPSIDGANECQCSTVTYSLISACGLCQNRTISSWSEWSGNCPTVFISTFPLPIPQGTLVPGWAYLDVKSTGFFDESLAKENANATESTAVPTPTTTSSSIIPSSTSSAEPSPTPTPGATSAEEATKAERKSDTIGSAVVGALLGLILIVGVIVGFYIRRQRRQKAAKSNNQHPETDGSSVEKDSAIMGDDAFGMHPNKRRKIDEDESRYVQAIIPEVDIEIGLRERLAETIEGRIAWALALQEALTNGTANDNQAPFKDIALDVLGAIESRSDIIFHNEHATPVAIHPIKPTGRPPPKEKPNTRSQKAKFIYLRSDDQIFLLRCPTCLKTAFNALQGLYNHGRMAHNLDWGTQEQCVKACAVPRHELDHELDLDNGIDITGAAGGVRPGVRSLFEMAIEGSHGDSEGGLHLTRTLGWHSETPALAQFLGKEARRKGIKVWDEEEDVDVDGFEGLLNVNQDGQNVKPQWRMSYTHRSVPKEDIQIESTTADSVQMHGDGAEPSANTDDAGGNPQSTSRFPHHLQGHCYRPLFCLYLRFAIDSLPYVMLLILRIDERSPQTPDHTHKWMITVESSAYSLDLTTVLTSLTVTSLSDESALSSADSIKPVHTKEPPFLVVGTTAEPFLARVELKFTPSKMRPEGQTVVLEHWLDMLGAGSPCKGDEQVVDVELDKDTTILPAKTGYIPVKSKKHWESIRVKEEAEDDAENALNTPPQNDQGLAKTYTDYATVLKTLLPKFPMTIGLLRVLLPTIRLPYKLVADQEQFKSLMMGRRKAIEWGRAKAIRDAYAETLEKEGIRSIPLTVGDVFRWLEDEGYFIRDEKVEEQPEIKGKAKGRSREQPDDQWCRVCGLGYSFHTIATTTGTNVGTPSTSDFRCRIVPKELQYYRIPTIDVEIALKKHLLRAKGATTAPDSSQVPTTHSRLARSKMDTSEWVRRLRNHDIVMAVEPNLTEFRFLTTSNRPNYPIAAVGTNLDAVRASVAPHAYLALVMKQFIQYLVKAGLETSRRDTGFGVGFNSPVQNRYGQDHYSNTPLPTPMSTAMAVASANRKKAAGGGKKKEPMNKVQTAIKVLTPMHILAGVITRYAQARATQQFLPGGIENQELSLAVYRCLARLGIGVVDIDTSSE
ncbi:hypothetical protein VNI00_003150 [Paramarasmius palmivorus]|uniref:YEATS domain-containing protein n=1 Tax=Paramarasmius palmivorus TaxID=297713 RepID=A0AAW0DSE2_9AGAR